MTFFSLNLEILRANTLERKKEEKKGGGAGYRSINASINTEERLVPLQPPIST